MAVRLLASSRWPILLTGCGLAFLLIAAQRPRLSGHTEGELIVSLWVGILLVALIGASVYRNALWGFYESFLENRQRLCEISRSSSSSRTMLGDTSCVRKPPVRTAEETRLLHKKKKRRDRVEVQNRQVTRNLGEPSSSVYSLARSLTGAVLPNWKQWIYNNETECA